MQIYKNQIKSGCLCCHCVFCTTCRKTAILRRVRLLYTAISICDGKKNALSFRPHESNDQLRCPLLTPEWMSQFR